MIKEPMFISPRTFRDYEQYKTDCARASGWNEAMEFIFAEELETERTRTIREKFFVVEKDTNVRSKDCETCLYTEECDWESCRYEPKTEPQTKCDTCKTYWNCQGQCDEMPQIEDEPQTDIEITRAIVHWFIKDYMDNAMASYEWEADEPQTVLNDYSKADDCMECEKFFDCDAPDEVKHASRVTDCAWGKGENNE